MKLDEATKASLSAGPSPDPLLPRNTSIPSKRYNQSPSWSLDSDFRSELTKVGVAKPRPLVLELRRFCDEAFEGFEVELKKAKR